MKLVNLKHHPDYVRFSKTLTIKVNDLITAEAECCGGVVNIDSKLFGKVIVLEDPDTCLTFYVGDKKTKYQGFKELYNQLFQDNYDDFLSSIERFAENEVLNTFENNINSLTTNQKINLLKEQIEARPTFESDCGKTICYNQWTVNQVLYTLNIPQPRSKNYKNNSTTRLSYGVEISVYQNILNELLNK